MELLQEDYSRILEAKRIVIKKIRDIDPSFALPNIEIKYTSVPNKFATLKNENEKWILEVNPVDIRNFDTLLRVITHEFVHYWLGADLKVGWKLFPQNINGIEDNFGLYKMDNLSLRSRLFCFLYQQFKFNNKFGNMINIDSYYDINFKGGYNPYIQFEEQLVNYTTMKIWDDDLSSYPYLQKAFQKNFDDKEILLFMENKMPHLRFAVEYLLTNF